MSSMDGDEKEKASRGIRREGSVHFRCIEVKNQLGNLLLILDAQIAEATYEQFDMTIGNAMESGLNRMTEYINNNIKAYLDEKIKDAYVTSESIRDNIQAATKNLDTAASSILEHVKTIASALTQQTATYVNTAQQAFAPDHQDILLRNDRRSCQLTLTQNPEWSMQATALTPREMVAKVNEAMGSVDPRNYTPGGDHFTMCRILNNGSIILEVKSKAMIVDLQDEHICRIFLATLGASFAQVKDSSFSMLLKFVPVDAGLDELDAWHAIEVRQG
ncbi:hypothetical protein EWM64_g9993 [Hericium alpestre]|uniref:Uncharacterized protein n=1 Tax=Hericium alpestre TaxID=135208 RepID=A0A4Y9ZKR2_9AGAM|nr:hypothetical protein EWM64_g9993 [Hericium alpestre]